LKWSEDEKYLFTSEYGGIIRAYDAKTLELLDSYGVYNEHEKGWCLDFDFSDSSNTKSTIYVGYEVKYFIKINIKQKDIKM
jgi:WD40 repeat protein